MCARYAFYKVQLFQSELDLFAEDVEPHYNIAPTDVAPIMTHDGVSRRFGHMRWGLVPSWSKDPSIGQKLINARAETLVEKPSFRTAFKKRRCLVPADGFFEWKNEKGGKQPYYFRMRTQAPFAMAGLWEYWEGANGALATFAIVTTEPNELLSRFHNRMPVVISRANYDEWLDPSVQNTEQIRPLLAPYDSVEMEVYAVTKAMSNPSFESPSIVEPIPSETLF